MTNHARRNSTAYDGRPEIREEIHALLGLAAMHADHGRDYAANGLDNFLGTSLEHAALYLRTAIKHFDDLQADNRKREAEGR